MENFRIENLSYSYPESEKKSLDNVSLKIEKGEYIVLCGRPLLEKLDRIKLKYGMIGF